MCCIRTRALRLPLHLFLQLQSDKNGGFGNTEPMAALIKGGDVKKEPDSGGERKEKADTATNGSQKEEEDGTMSTSSKKKKESKESTRDRKKRSRSKSRLVDG